MLNKIIENSIRYIQPVWPLQQFIATNPFWDKIDTDIKSLTADIFVKTGNLTFHKLSQLTTIYHTEKIKDHCLLESIEEHLSLAAPSHIHAKTHKINTKNIIYRFIKNILRQNQNDAFWISLTHDPRETLVAYRLSTVTNQPVSSLIKSDCIRWISRYMSLAKQNKKISEITLFQLWHQSLSKIKSWHFILTPYPDDVDSFIESLLKYLNVSKQSTEDYIFQIIWQLKGWFGHMKWQQENVDNPWNEGKLKIKDLIAIWLAYEVYYIKKYNNIKLPKATANVKNSINDLVKKNWQNLPEKFDFDLNYFDVVFILQRAFETSKRNEILDQLIAYKKPIRDETRPVAQWVFCIDTRSEGIRRHLESLNDYETYGYAGFFGFANQFHDDEKGLITNQYPAILQPSHVVRVPQSKTHASDQVLWSLANNIVAHRKAIPAAYFVYEIFGMWFAVINLIKTFYPEKSARILKKFEPHNSSPKKENEFTITNIKPFYEVALNVLKGMSLTNKFSKFVIICGHHAQTEGNPYKSSLDCGACGGHSGFYNATFACQIFNNKQVRKYLSQNSIDIPDETVFIAACHNTTTGNIEFDLKSESLIDEFSVIRQDAQHASNNYNQERSKDFIGYKEFNTRANDWAQLMPELGLINNFSIIIGPRQMTQNMNLNRSVFLHSYSADKDHEGKILSTILGGPVLVAHWINMQYFYASVCPELYSSGNKAIHNIVSGIGVMEGNQSDLKSGLPLQSLYYKNKLLHEPRRLEVIVIADPTLVNNLVNKNETLNNLIKGGWIFLKCVEGKAS